MSEGQARAIMKNKGSKAKNYFETALVGENSERGVDNLMMDLRGAGWHPNELKQMRNIYDNDQKHVKARERLSKKLEERKRLQ